MSHLLLASFLVEMNFSLSLTDECKLTVLYSCSKRRDASGIRGWNRFVSFWTVCGWEGWRMGDFFFFFLQQQRGISCFGTEISHPRFFDTSLTIGEHAASVYCWFLGVKQPSTAFIVPLIALNAAAFLLCLARLWKLSRGYFVIKFTVISSGGTGSVKFEITSGHF